MTTPALARRLGLGALVLYGIGDILGAGIYALVGKVAGEAGSSSWVSFIVAAILAIVTGLSYAELASRVPRAAGAAAYAGEAFRGRLVPFLVGFLVLASGVASASTVSLAVHGYLTMILDVPQVAAAVALVLGMSLVSFLGIRESAGLNNVFTIVEAAGLALVLGVGARYIQGAHLDLFAHASMPHGDWLPVLSGATLAFYAFIGFEDLANLSEEAKNPSRDVPRAMIIAVSVCTVVYMAVLFVVLGVMTPADAAASERPLLEVLKRAGFPMPPAAFSVIALFAIVNTGMANLVMASRLLYGMAREGLLPARLAAVHERRQTPWIAVLVTMIICLVLVVSGGAKVLAQTTSLLLVIVFLVVHISLIILRRREKSADFRSPAAAPYVGIIFCLLLMSRSPSDAWMRAGIAILAGLAVYRMQRFRA